jgi:hypothetical protein
MANTIGQYQNHQNRRFNIHLPIHFRVSQKGETSRWATGVTCDISSCELTFRCRKPLPVGAHVEMFIEWPARQDDYPLELVATGFVVRSSASKASVSMTAHRFRTEVNAGEQMGAIA